jgi:transcriptional regulator with XRE-family HTH domain
LVKRAKASDQRTARPLPDVGQRLRAHRAAAGLTQEVLARRAHLTGKFVSQIENGHVNPSVDALMRLVEHGLGIPTAAFFAGVDGDDVRDDLIKLEALVAVRRRVLRTIRALCDE